MEIIFLWLPRTEVVIFSLFPGGGSISTQVTLSYTYSSLGYQIRDRQTDRDRDLKRKHFRILPSVRCRILLRSGPRQGEGHLSRAYEQQENIIDWEHHLSKDASISTTQQLLSHLTHNSF